ncbi:hypothetical protein J6590_022630 [Homalodisca vitripennis]|nr:hypothetical protein J6590_022630 [Homalodisca vitripennis]
MDSRELSGDPEAVFILPSLSPSQEVGNSNTSQATEHCRYILNDVPSPLRLSLTKINRQSLPTVFKEFESKSLWLVSGSLPDLSESSLTTVKPRTVRQCIRQLDMTGDNNALRQRELVSSDNPLAPQRLCLSVGGLVLLRSLALLSGGLVSL